MFDNAPDRASVERFVPPAGPGRVLITTQNQHWPPGQALDVPVLDTEVAADFLVNRTGDADRAAARELAAELGGLPLALEQAAAYMQATGTTLARYLPLFRDRQADLLARGEAAGHPADVAATLGLALSRLAGEAPAAAGLVRCWRSWPPSRSRWPCCSPVSRLRACWARRSAAGVGPLLGDPVAAGDAITALRRYSLVAPAGDGLVLVHRLVQAITRAQLTGGGGWPVGTGRRGPGRGGGPRRPGAARGVAGVRGAAAARPGCPRPDQRRHAADRAVPRAIAAATRRPGTCSG